MAALSSRAYSEGRRRGHYADRRGPEVVPSVLADVALSCQAVGTVGRTLVLTMRRASGGGETAIISNALVEAQLALWRIAGAMGIDLEILSDHELQRLEATPVGQLMQQEKVL